MKIVINVCYGGFGLSDAAYEWLIAHGIPRQKYVEQQRGEDGLYQAEPRNDGRVIFDRELTPPGEDTLNDMYWERKGRKGSLFSDRYWDIWTGEARADPLIVQCVEELGATANGRCAELRVVEIPDGVTWQIEEYDGLEHVAEAHRTWV